jgi:hypothetical protein
MWLFFFSFFLEQANTHIHANPKLGDVKLWQVYHISLPFCVEIYEIISLVQALK